LILFIPTVLIYGYTFAMLDRRFAKPRQRLVEQLKEKGIEDPLVLKAIGTLPRHTLIDTALHHRAYEDSALPIGLGQTISQPFTVAKQTELLGIQPGDKILEIGTGSGYQCMVLCELKAEVYSVERHNELYHKAKDALRALGYRPQLKCGDGTLGWSTYAPYHGIVVTAGAPVVPDDLIRQLHIGGRLIIPVGSNTEQSMLRITRVSEEEYGQEEYEGFKFVPLIGQKGWKE
jgi:protein-L-isoaspartate(D-aspartate) O-methyltransferase